MTIEILDAHGNLIQSYTGKQPDNKSNNNVPWYMRSGPAKPTTKAGINEFTWDLNYPGATVFDG